MQTRRPGQVDGPPSPRIKWQSRREGKTEKKLEFGEISCWNGRRRESENNRIVIDVDESELKARSALRSPILFASDVAPQVEGIL